MIAEQALRAGEIVHRVRGFARAGRAGHGTGVAIHVVHATVGFAEFEARAHVVHFVLDLTEPLPPVQADQVQLEQVLSNLVKNGIDAMSAISGERVLVIRHGSEPTAAWRSPVIDHGEGLAEAVRGDPSAPFCDDQTGRCRTRAGNLSDDRREP